MKATWKHHEDNHSLDAKERKELPASVYAFPGKRKEPLNNASHVRNAIARFDPLKDVTKTSPIQNASRPSRTSKPQRSTTEWR